jgi:hypothetical protein
MTPFKTLNDKTPFEVWSRIKLTLTHLKVFASYAYVLIPKENRQNLGSHTIVCIFLNCS